MLHRSIYVISRKISAQLCRNFEEKGMDKKNLMLNLFYLNQKKA